jgi:predicted extracellular nuclease
MRSMPVVRLLAASACAATLAILCTPPSGAISGNIVISQVYGGGGNSGATLTNDFIELFNRGTSAVNVTGWSVQYASATGSTWQVTPLSGTIAPGQYYLVQEAQGAGGTTSLPTPDATGVIAMSATTGKVALSSSNTALTGACPSGGAIVDLFGFGPTASCFEGAPTGTLTNTTAALRGDAGCTETDSNSTDFATGAPIPRNSLSPTHSCTGPPSISIDDVTVAEGNSGTATANFTVSLSAAFVLPVTFDITTADDSATTANNDYVSNALTSQVIPAGSQTYSFQVTINGDTDIEPHESFFVQLSGITGAAAGDIQGTGTITNDDVAPPIFDVVISQIYGGGGNGGATYTNDFVELFNHGTTPISLAGWSVQYQSAAGTGTWQVTPLAGTIAPGGYYLVQQAQGAGGTTGLPSPDATGTIPMSATVGKVVLRTNSTAITGACAAGLTIVDIVGYGATATCFEGSGPTAPLSNTTAALRKRGGCFDSNNNAADFSIGGPLPRNSGSPTRTCDYITLPIHTIQGTGPATPYLGQDVTTSGIVTGIKSNGFFAQAPDSAADSDATTSEAIFVFTGALPAVSVGGEVSIKGTASEFFGLTQLESSLAGDVATSSTGNPLPAAVELTPLILSAAGAPTQLEPLEAMRVYAGALVSVGPTNEFGETDTVLQGVARPMREPGIEASLTVPPDPTSGVIDCCIPRWDENPERIMVDSDGLAGAMAVGVSSGVTLSNVVGPLDYTFGNYKILPEAHPLKTADIAPVAVPVPAANEFTVAGFNIENYAGANTQKRKAALAIRQLMRSPDVIGHIEIANLASLQALADQVNADAVAAGETDPAYQAVLIPAPAGGTQNVWFLVKGSRVTVVTVSQEAEEETYINPVNGQPETLHDRPPLVLHATVNNGTSAEPIIVVVNHPRSFIDIDVVAGEGTRVRAKRTAQAESIAQLLQNLQTAHRTTPVIAVGDYNAYQFNDGYTDPISVLKGMPTPDDQIVVDASPDLVTPDFVNLTDTMLMPDQRYSFVFEGTPQALDHVLINTVAASIVQRYAVARANADYPETAFYTADATRPERSSDHDMPVAYFAFPGTPVVILNGSATMNVEAFTPFVDPGATAHDDTGPLAVTVAGMVNTSVPGDYTLSYTAQNLFHTTTVTRTVRVRDTIAPTIVGFTLTPSALGVPNHNMVSVSALYSVSDSSGSASCSLSVSSNEAANGEGDGNTSVDWQVLGPTSLMLRSERSGGGSGRVYTVTVTCVDPSGNPATKIATATVAR